MKKFLRLRKFFTSCVKSIGAIPSIPFITAGTLSRKLAAGAEGVVVDVNGEKVPSLKMQRMRNNSPVH